MGLDMYLTGKIYIGANYEHNDVSGSINLKKAGMDVDVPIDKIDNIEIGLGYWRKANAIHKFFIDNCGRGDSEAQCMYVERDALKELLELCKRVEKNHDIAEALLPTQSGFFFGYTEYNDYYFNCINDTIHIIEDALKYKYVDYYYSASW